MSRFLGLLGAVTVLWLVAAWSRSDRPADDPAIKDVQIQVEAKNPWNNLKFNNDPKTFRFAIVTDRTGGARAGVFERAVEQLNILQPEFVVSVGDLIQGNEDLAKIDKQWQEFNGFISKLQMPFFYMPGNHDLANPVMEKRWIEQFGRRYYHFVYKDVLFLFLNSEDPPKTKFSHFGDAQRAYARKVLQENAKARWTLVFIHRPVWAETTVAKSGWLDIEKDLGTRGYTVFAGHRHNYKRYERNGRLYYQLATTGGSSQMRGVAQGEFDHLVWVTMKDDGPVLANLMLDGIYAENLSAIKVPEKPAKKKT